MTRITKNIKIIRNFIKICFAFYLLALLILLFLKGIHLRSVRLDDLERYGFWQGIQFCVNLTPFRTISGYLKQMDSLSLNSIHDFAFQNLAGNVILFLPMGVFLPYFSEKQRKFPRFFLTALLMILSVELLQLLTLTGACDIDDVILNLPGACIGFGIFCIMKNILKYFKKIEN